MIQADVQALFDYQDTLIWKARLSDPAWTARWAGKPAGGAAREDGYVQVKAGGRFYRRSRLVWVWHNGAIPAGLWVDHINRDRSDDRIENLRLATPSENACNSESRSNLRGARGVTQFPRCSRFYVRVAVGGVRKYVGSYATASEAETAYKEAAEHLHGDFMKGVIPHG